MGLKAPALDLLVDVGPWESVLCLSYPDVLVPFDEVQKLYPVTKRTNHGAWHGRKFDLPETTELFTLLGAKSVRYVDIHASRGCEEIVDLNQPQDLGLHDLVIDPGTTEHCFNVGQAMKNAANAVKVGGHIFHTPPASMVNHGFWNFNPTTFWDFYSQNGFQVAGMWFEHDEELHPAPATKRLAIPPEMSLFCLAKRVEEREIRWPTQSKYLANPDLK